MKKLVVLAGVVMMFAACKDHKAETDAALEHQRDSLQAIINAKDGELNDLMATFKALLQA